jgi:predicted signal transduction protein with EAL and GGDEF domain
VLLLEHGSRPEVVADRLHELLREPFRVGGDVCRLRMSIGTARVGVHELTPTAQHVLEKADADMYAVKAGGAARARPPAAGAAGGGPVTPAALAGALHSGAIQLVYQPLVDPGTGSVRAVEALVRWRHGEQLLLPDAFLGVAEGAGLADRLTDVVLEQGCAQLRAWSAAAGHSRLTLAVNVTPAQISDPSLGARVRAAVERHACSLSRSWSRRPSTRWRPTRRG